MYVIQPYFFVCLFVLEFLVNNLPANTYHFVDYLVRFSVIYYNYTKNTVVNGRQKSHDALTFYLLLNRGSFRFKYKYAPNQIVFD